MLIRLWLITDSGLIVSQLISALKSNGVHPTGVETEKKFNDAQQDSLRGCTFTVYIIYVSIVLGCVCIWCAWVCLSSTPGCENLVYSGECVILFIKMMEVVDTQNGLYCMYTNGMTVFRVVVSYTCNVSGVGW